MKRLIALVLGLALLLACAAAVAETAEKESLGILKVNKSFDIRYNPLPNDYTMSGTPAVPAQKMPDQTLMLVWSIILTCLCSVCGVVGLVKTVKAQKTLDPTLRYKLLSSAKIWLIIGTALRVLPFLAELL